MATATLTQKKILTFDEIERLRAYRWRTAPGRQFSDERGALRFISELGFVLLMPIAGTALPSIQTGAQEVEFWSWWEWKQTLPERKACYYAKVLRRRGTFIAWKWFPQFYAAYADPRPYWRQFQEGKLSRDEKRMLDLLEERGLMMTSDVRLAFGPSSKQNTRYVKKILTDLQTKFLITAAGGDTEGWSHHRWDLVFRWAPSGLLMEASAISRQSAREALIVKFTHNMVATTVAEIAWLFGWERREVDRMIAKLLEHGALATVFVPDFEIDMLVVGFKTRSARSK